MLPEEAQALGHGLARNTQLRVLKLDRMVLEPQGLSQENSQQRAMAGRLHGFRQNPGR